MLMLLSARPVTELKTRMRCIRCKKKNPIMVNHTNCGWRYKSHLAKRRVDAQFPTCQRQILALACTYFVFRRCTFRNCKRVHECEVCGGGHRGMNCRERARYNPMQSFQRGGRSGYNQNRFGSGYGQQNQSSKFTGFNAGGYGGAGRGRMQ